MIFNRRETPVATVNLISLIENEHLKWGQIEQQKWMENSIHLQGRLRPANVLILKIQADQTWVHL